GDRDGRGTEPEPGHTDDTSGKAEDASERTADAGDRKDTPETGATVSATGDRDGRGTEPEPGHTDDTSGKAEDASERTADATESKSGAADAADVSHDQDGPEAPRAEDEPENATHATAGAGTGADAPEPTADASRDQDDSGSAGTDAGAPRAEEEPEDVGTNTDAPEAAASAGDEDESEGAGKGAGDASRGQDGSGETAQDGPGAGTAEAAALAGSDEGDSEAGSSGGGDEKPVAGAPEAVDDASAEDGEDDRHGEDEPGDGSAAADAAGTGAAGGDGRPKATGPVDQPTAVFRTGRPSAPAVDQPTTMLKLGDVGREAAAESERTSKFVALKRDDDLGGRKPPAAPAAPAAPAGVTSSLPQVGPERTTQQPLPPRPPLDLLAELTNTPPPPQTPLRTAVRRVKIWTPLVLLLVIVFAVVQNMRPLPAPTLELTAEDGYTFEGAKPEIPWPADGQAALDVDGIGTFGSSGEQKPVPIASVAKVMTAYLVLRDHPLKSGAEGPMIKIDDLAEKQSDAGQESTVDVTAGDEISQREAVEAILIASANNVARLLARWDAGSEEAFVEKMNAAAKDLGMTDTTYTDPSGLNDTTVSTAVDQVKLARAAMEQPAFREVAAMMSYDDYKGVNHPNWNQLVGHNDVVGIKTGTTTSALGNLVFAAKKDVDGETHRIIGAVVRQPAGGKDNTILSAALTSGDELIRAAQDVLESATILKKGEVVGYVDDGLGGRTPVAVTEDVKAVGWAGLSVKLTFAADELPHTAKAGTKVGALTVGDGTSGAVEVPVALREDLVEPGFTDKLTRLS
ncbi:D-alanyl-D-alanine carboxypeptidase, partial [Streptomyces sp. NPDC051740]|uniref:D-alanyl-D-alanine carboxypeptidase n=1 Tax=Streptomyces sp. NPDC051740 TaxID=3365673 RepID=UPI0037B1CF65